ncbi:MAG: response regulator transcription factor [Candidatus Omnitrophica bacterium]|nr:response regulator transcription factor [Candidatus Omnitrophota bacterium]
MRILIVEDEQKVADFIKRGLKEEGYAVDVAYDGEQGHFLATTNDHDLIILDVMLPEIDGITLCQRLRKEKVLIPILMLTARDAVLDKVKGLDSGANDYLTKPFAFAELLARIRSLLRHAENHQAINLQVGDLTLDVVTHKASRAGQPIELTLKEYALLEYLMRNAGTIVTRTMISEHVWDIHFDTFTNVIDVYINYLRRKIDQGFKKKLLHTVRGRGYILKEG